MLDDFKNAWLKPFCKEFNINIDIDEIVDRDDVTTSDQLIKLIKILKLEPTDNNESMLKQWTKISKYQFRGYNFSWIKEFLYKVVLKVIKFNKKISYDHGQSFIDICTIERNQKDAIEKTKKDAIEQAEKETNQFKWQLCYPSWLSN